MSTIIWVIVTLFLVFISYIFGSSSAKKSKNHSEKTVFDMTQNYMSAVHEFLSREYSFEIHKRFTEFAHINNTSSSSTTAIRALSNDDKFREIATGITINCISRMSDDVKNAFYRLYERSDDMITEYVSRWVIFKLRSLITTISAEIQLNSLSDPKDALNTSDIAEKTLLDMEFDVYRLHNITVSDDSKSLGAIPETLNNKITDLNGGR